jgi:hypothetical protein
MRSGPATGARDAEAIAAQIRRIGRRSTLRQPLSPTGAPRPMRSGARHRGRNGATAEASRIGFNRCRGIGRRFDVADRNHGRCGSADATGGRSDRYRCCADRDRCGCVPGRATAVRKGATAEATAAQVREPADGSADDRVPPTGTTAGAERGTPPEKAIGRIVQELPTDRPPIPPLRPWPHRFNGCRRIGRRSVSPNGTGNKPRPADAERATPPEPRTPQLR